jgi:hypothetical protein
MITSDGRGILVDWDLANDTNNTGVPSFGGIVRTSTNGFCIHVDSVK